MDAKNVPLDQALLPDKGNPLLPWQFVPNTGLNIFKIVQTGTISVTGPSISRSTVGATINATVTLIPHSLGYIPGIIAYVNDGTTYQLCPTEAFEVQHGSGTAWGMDFIEVVTDAVNITFEVRSRLFVFTASGTDTQGPNQYTIKYFLLHESAS